VDTHSFSRGLPSAGEGHKSSDSLELLTWRQMSSPHAYCKALEHLSKTGPKARRCRRRGAGSRRAGSMGQGCADTVPSWGAERDGKAAEERRGIPFGSVFVHEWFSSRLKLAEDLWQSYPVLEDLIMVVVQHLCPLYLLAILCLHRECRSGQKKEGSMVSTSLNDSLPFQGRRCPTSLSASALEAVPAHGPASTASLGVKAQQRRGSTGDHDSWLITLAGAGLNQLLSPVSLPGLMA